MSRRDHEKQKRRDKILAAAKGALRDGGATGLTMRELATRAGVSVMTPYNLIGSKHDILMALLHQNTSRLEEEYSAQKERPAEERAYWIIEATTNRLREDSYYMQSIVTLLITGAIGKELERTSWPWVGLWKEAASVTFYSASCDEAVNFDTFFSHLNGCFNEALLEWALTRPSPDVFEARCGYSFSLAYLGAVTPRDRPFFLARLKSYETKLSALFA